VSAADADRFLRPEDVVGFFRLGGVTYVYPELILGYHHVINEDLGGVQLAITECMLSGTTLAYLRRLRDRTLTLRALVATYNGNVVLEDGETGSRWIQMTGEAFDGRLRPGTLPLAQTLEKASWSKARGLEPMNVLAPIHPMEEYRSFANNIHNGRLGLELLERSKPVDPRLPPYTEGLGITVHGSPRFYPLDAIRGPGLVNDELGGWAILLVHDPDLDTVRLFRRWVGERRLGFRRESGSLRDLETGSRWSHAGICLEGPLQGQRLSVPVYTYVYWFSWAAFHPETTYAEVGKKPGS
jgi:hypothetical protein